MCIIGVSLIAGVYYGVFIKGVSIKEGVYYRESLFRMCNFSLVGNCVAEIQFSLSLHYLQMSGVTKLHNFEWLMSILLRACNTVIYKTHMITPR